MELAVIDNTLHNCISTTTITTVGSVENLKKCEKKLVPLNDTVETASLGTISGLSSDSTEEIVADGASQPVQPIAEVFSVKNYCPHVVLVIIILFVIAVMQIPSILYYTNVTAVSISPLIDNVDFHSCLVDSSVQQVINSDTTLLQSCEAQGIQIIDSNCSNTTAVRAFQSVYAISTLTRSIQCSEDALSFFCNAINSLCVNTSYLPPVSEECIEVRDNTCSSEWRVAERIVGISVPDCSSFSGDSNLTFSFAPVQTCPDIFEVFCGSLCLPSCTKITLVRDGVDVFFRVWITVLYAVNLIGVVITFISCILHRQKMLRYPLIFIVYNAVTWQVFVFFILLPTILGSNDLLCSDPNLIVSTGDPSTFCYIQGFVVHTAVLLLIGFWLVHILHMFFSLKFPFRAQRFMASDSAKRKVHLIELVIIVIIALICSVTAVSISGYDFVGYPRACGAGAATTFFYTFIVPIMFGVTVGISVLFSSVWLVRRRSAINSSRDVSTKTSAAEIKLFVFFLYYGVTVVLLLSGYSALLRNLDSLSDAVNDFVTCAIGGNKVECDVHRERLYEIVTVPVVLDWISSTLGLFVSFINLNFILNYSDVKNAFKYMLRLLKHTT